MKPILENAVLGSDLDCQGFAIHNLGHLQPVPPSLVASNDPALSDARSIIPGSVTDDSVAANAAIGQDKLNFDGDIPGAWLGTGPSTAAPGDLVERVENKGVAGGYVELDANGLIPSVNIDAGVDPGTVNSVNLIMPLILEVTGNPIEASGNFVVTWADQPDESWLGVNGQLAISTGLVPSFIVNKIPLELIPDLDATQFTTGEFDTDRLPEAVGVGVDHAVGIVPDPGENGDPDDYLGRDMEWRSFSMTLSYQPTLPNVLISASLIHTLVSVSISSPQRNSRLFYRLNGGSFTEVPSGRIRIFADLGDFVEAYAAKAGWNNSSVATYTVQTPVPV